MKKDSVLVKVIAVADTIAVDVAVLFLVRQLCLQKNRLNRLAYFLKCRFCGLSPRSSQR